MGLKTASRGIVATIIMALSEIPQLTATIFSGSKIPLNYWYYFIFYYLQNHSTNQLSQVLGISYKTALGMARKIQKCLKGTCNDRKE